MKLRSSATLNKAAQFLPSHAAYMTWLRWVMRRRAYQNKHFATWVLPF